MSLKLSGVSERLRPDLVPVVKEYQATEGKGIAKEIFPERPTKKKSHIYGIFGLEQMLQQADDTAARGARANRVDVRIGEGEYSVKKRSLETPIHDDEREDFDAQYGSEIKGEEAKLKALMNAMSINREIRCVDKVFDSSRFPAHNLTTPWSELVASDPEQDVRKALLDMRKKGYEGRDLVVSYETFKNLQANQKIKEYIKYTYGKLTYNQLTAAEIAQILGVNRVLIGDALVNENGLYAQDEDLKGIWPSEFAALIRTPVGFGFDQACFGWGWVYRGTADDVVVDEYREPEIETDFLRGIYWADDVLVEGEYPDGQKIDIASKCIHIFGNVAA